MARPIVARTLPAPTSVAPEDLITPGTAASSPSGASDLDVLRSLLRRYRPAISRPAVIGAVVGLAVTMFIGLVLATATTLAFGNSATTVALGSPVPIAVGGDAIFGDLLDRDAYEIGTFSHVLSTWQAMSGASFVLEDVKVDGENATIQASIRSLVGMLLIAGTLAAGLLCGWEVERQMGARAPSATLGLLLVSAFALLALLSGAIPLGTVHSGGSLHAHNGWLFLSSALCGSVAWWITATVRRIRSTGRIRPMRGPGFAEAFRSVVASAALLSVALSLIVVISGLIAIVADEPDSSSVSSLDSAGVVLARSISLGIEAAPLLAGAKYEAVASGVDSGSTERVGTGGRIGRIFTAEAWYYTVPAAVLGWLVLAGIVVGTGFSIARRNFNVEPWKRFAYAGLLGPVWAAGFTMAIAFFAPRARFAADGTTDRGSGHASVAPGDTILIMLLGATALALLGAALAALGERAAGSDQQ